MAIAIQCPSGPVPDGDEPRCPVCGQAADVFSQDVPPPLGGTFMRHYTVESRVAPIAAAPANRTPEPA